MSSEVMKLRNRITVIKSEIVSQERNYKGVKQMVREASLKGDEERAEKLDETARNIQARIERMNEDVDALEGMMPDAIKADALPQRKSLQLQYDNLYQTAVNANEKLKQALEAAMAVLDDATTSAVKAQMLVRQSDRLEHDTGLSGIKERQFPLPGGELADMAGTIRNHIGGAPMALGAARNATASLAHSLSDKRNAQTAKRYAGG